MALNGQNVFHHAQIESNLPITVQIGYEIQYKNVGLAAHFGLVPKNSVNFLLELQSNAPPSVQQRNAFIETGITNGSAFDINLKYYFKPEPNSFYLSFLGTFPTLNFQATFGDYLKNLGISNPNLLLNKTLINASFQLPLVGLCFGKRFKIVENLSFQAELGMSKAIKSDPSVPTGSASGLQELIRKTIQSKMEETIAQQQKSGVLPTLKVGIDYRF